MFAKSLAALFFLGFISRVSSGHHTDCGRPPVLVCRGQANRAGGVLTESRGAGGRRFVEVADLDDLELLAGSGGRNLEPLPNLQGKNAAR